MQSIVCTAPPSLPVGFSWVLCLSLFSPQNAFSLCDLIHSTVFNLYLYHDDSWIYNLLQSILRSIVQDSGKDIRINSHKSKRGKIQRERYQKNQEKEWLCLSQKSYVESLSKKIRMLKFSQSDSTRCGALGRALMNGISAL